MKDLQTLSDEAEIRALTCRYGDCYDRADAAGYGGTFLSDGMLDSNAIGFGIAVGPEAIAEVVRQVSHWPISCPTVLTNSSNRDMNPSLSNSQLPQSSLLGGLLALGGGDDRYFSNRSGA